MDTKFENIVPWNGSNDTGRDVRLKWERNFKRIADALKELSDTDKQIIKDILKEIDKIFLHKDKEDSTNYLLKFGEFIDSMVAGKGAGIFPDGRAQFERLEVRDSLTVLELIFNRLSAMESDYSFSESGTIESVSQLEDGTYSLKMKKRWDNDLLHWQKTMLYMVLSMTLHQVAASIIPPGYVSCMLTSQPIRSTL